MKTRFSRSRRVLALCCALFLLLTACSTVKPAPEADTDADTAGLNTEVPPAGSSGSPAETRAAAESGAIPKGELGEDFSSESSRRMASMDRPSDSLYAGSKDGISPSGSLEPAPVVPGKTGDSADPGQGSALVLTAAEWNDNDNWPFFTNLVSAGTVSFPSFGIDPRYRIRVTVQSEDGTALVNETVTLAAEDGTVLWTARTDKDGTAFLFFAEGQSPAAAVCGEASAPVQIRYSGEAQGKTVVRQAEEVTITKSAEASALTGLQIMFIVDTTGSMSDELVYLQKDFAAITQRIQTEDVSYCACFYRDEGDDYVTKTGSFSSDVQAVQAQINAEYADGGGDAPEAVDQILTETLKDFSGWREDCVKLAFLIFDAPPHEGTDAKLTAAIRAAAERGIRLIPVVASNAERDTELFGRAIAICTGGTYVFLTDDSGVGESHLEPIVGDYEVKLLQDLIVEIITRYQP